MAGANARLAEATAGADETTRAVLRDVARAFYEAVFAAERIRLFTTAETLARAVFDAADRRHRAGDIPVLDVNLARASLGAGSGRAASGRGPASGGARHAQGAAPASRRHRRARHPGARPAA